MSRTFDAIVIGSGFGGAITACRLAEKGMRVLVLERGRRWKPAEYPRKPGDAWLFSDREPARRNGWLDLRFFKNMTVTQAAGVGGGSLAYSSVALEAHPSLFERGWPTEVTYAELKPYYDAVARTMNLQTVPDGQLTQRFKLAREGAAELGHQDRFGKTPLAVTFSPDWHYQLDDPFNVKHSKTFTNAQGQQQGTCIHLGNCDIGCDVRAKNTLDLNYIPLAEQRGAEVRPLHVVRTIEPAARRVPGRIRSHSGRPAGPRRRSVLPACFWRRAASARPSCCCGVATSTGRFQASAGCSAGGGVRTRTSSRWPLMPMRAASSRRLARRSRRSRFHGRQHRWRALRHRRRGFPNVLLNALRASLDAGARDRSGGSLLTQLEEHVRGDERSRN